MRIVISGATSMIGAALVNRLIGQGNEVIAVVRKDCKKLDNLNMNSRLTILNCDMCNYQHLNELINDNIDVAVAMAWNGTRGEQRNCRELQQDNLKYNINFLQSVLQLGCKKFLTAGSQAEYGLWTQKEKLKEDIEPHPNTEYGKYKLEFYKYAKTYCEEHNCTLIEPRFFSLYGPNDFYGTLIMSILKKMLNNEPCDLTECIQLWDFLYIDDAIDALCRLIEMRDASDIYNFGSGYSAPLKEYINIMMEVTQSKSELRYGAVSYPATGIVNVNPNIDRLLETGWVPKIQFSDGIRGICKEIH